MRTQEAVTPMPKIAIPFVIFTLIYIFLSVALLFLLRRQFMKTDAAGFGIDHEKCLSSLSPVSCSWR